MKSVFKIVSGVLIGFGAFADAAMAKDVFNVPEPGSLALVGLAVGVLVLMARAGKK